MPFIMLAAIPKADKMDVGFLASQLPALLARPSPPACDAAWVAAEPEVKSMASGIFDAGASADDADSTGANGAAGVALNCCAACDILGFKNDRAVSSSGAGGAGGFIGCTAGGAVGAGGAGGASIGGAVGGASVSGAAWANCDPASELNGAASLSTCCAPGAS